MIIVYFNDWENRKLHKMKIWECLNSLEGQLKALISKFIVYFYRVIR